MQLSTTECADFKAKYEEQIAELNRKKAVVDEFIAFAEAKEVVKSDEEETAVEEEIETDGENAEETVTETNY
jgi:hypothetical protein